MEVKGNGIECFISTSDDLIELCEILFKQMNEHFKKKYATDGIWYANSNCGMRNSAIARVLLETRGNLKRIDKKYPAEAEKGE